MEKKEFLNYIKSFNNIFIEDDLYDIGVKHKELPLGERSWNQLNELTGKKFNSGESYRTWVKSIQSKRGELPTNPNVLTNNTIDKLTVEEAEGILEEKRQLLYKQEVKNRDTIREIRTHLRNEARIEVLIEAISDTVEALEEIPKPQYCGTFNNNNEAVLLIGDFHIGALVNNFYNKFNLQIATDRIEKLKQDVIKLGQANQVKKLNVINLGDMYESNLHVSARVQSEIDAVSQIMQASEMLAKLLSDLSTQFEIVTYRSVLDNHSRINKNYNEHIEAENLGRIIDFYLIERLKNTSVKMIFDNIDNNIGKFKLENNKTICFVHGHLDNVNQIFQNMVGMTREFIDYAILGHYHTGEYKEPNGCKVIVNGSLKGVDEYALNHRLFSKPSQTLLIFDNDNLLDCRINLEQA